MKPNIGLHNAMTASFILFGDMKSEKFCTTQNVQMHVQDKSMQKGTCTIWLLENNFHKSNDIIKLVLSPKCKQCTKDSWTQEVAITFSHANIGMILLDIPATNNKFMIDFITKILNCNNLKIETEYSDPSQHYTTGQLILSSWTHNILDLK